MNIETEHLKLSAGGFTSRTGVKVTATAFCLKFDHRSDEKLA